MHCDRGTAGANDRVDGCLRDAAEIEERLDVRMRGVDGVWRWFDTLVTRAVGGEAGVVTIQRDITERKQRERALHSLTLEDDLTGLYNRRGFMTLAERHLKLAVRKKQGVFLLFCTLWLSFTGYLLPWDQLALWAVTVGTNMMGYTPVFGQEVRFVLLGGKEIGSETLLRWYVLHVLFLPFVIVIFMAIHFWRVRKDGGISGPL